MGDDFDYLFALELQKEYDKEDAKSQNNDDVVATFGDMKPPAKISNKLSQIKRSNPRSNLDEDYLNRTQNLVHPLWETLDPTPDVFALFSAFDGKFFQSRLKCVTLEWSKRMYSCAGICYYRSNRYGEDITIRLSEPLLKLRPRKDLVETMLHEMIHAYCFVLKIREGNGGHGPNFKKIMYAINKVAGTNITVYHTFHDEVDIYKQHWWRCNGSCQNRAPFFGYVKRTSNRAPSHNDQWWATHLESCGGTFMKIKGPDIDKKLKKEKENAEKMLKNKNKKAGNDLRKYFNITGRNGTELKNNNNNNNNIEAFKGPVKSNGGGTILLNSKTTNPVTKPATNPINKISAVLPPTSYPGLSTDPFNVSNVSQNPKVNQRIQNAGAFVSPGGNLTNVKGFRELNGGDSSNSRPKVNDFDISGKGYSLSSDSCTPSPNNKRNSEHVREIWAKRFGGNTTKGDKTNENTVVPIDDDEVTPPPTGDNKRRRISASSTPRTRENDALWHVVDDDIMVQEKSVETIDINSSSSDDDDNDADNSNSGDKTTTNDKKIPLTSQQRQQAIKQEILDESVLIDLRDEDIILIDDEYDDAIDDDIVANISAATELADTSIIDEFFGEDTLLKEFTEENDLRPSGSSFIPNPEKDIITCPICQEKMQRKLFSNHLDGCTGIAIKIKPPKYALQKLATESKEAHRNHQPRIYKKDLIRSTEETVNITLSSDEDEISPTRRRDTNTSLSPEVVAIEDEINTRRYRQRNLLKTTRQCPNCAAEIEENEINDHLDECLEMSNIF